MLLEMMNNHRSHSICFLVPFIHGIFILLFKRFHAVIVILQIWYGKLVVVTWEKVLSKEYLTESVFDIIITVVFEEEDCVSGAKYRTF